MMGRGPSPEVFRRSWLTAMPEWVVAGSVSLAAGLAAYHFGLLGTWEGLVLMGLPLIWAGGRTMHWLCHTWTVKADGSLKARRGVLFPTRQKIDLSSVSQVEADAPPPIGWLDIGHIAFEAADPAGQRRRFHRTWMRNHGRLCEIIRARGQLPIGRPSRWTIVSDAVRQRVRNAFRGRVRTPGRADLQDYGRFMAFCHLVLRAERGGRWPPLRISPVMVARWLVVLQQVRVVASASNERGWRVVPGIEGLDDIRRRLGPPDLQRAVQRSARCRFHQ